ncbi:Toll-like receptor 2 type-1-like [Phytophthora palmivora]|uniref:Toll-like receptor 2 type-1-like n=1 Tax=Phytophthora palmivora TaxID=4796 RepID=A0A2P4Y917_9STRA|nr:Toll-like receptor 2 type-1-like [Phytophthora palmivora]
MQPQNTRRVSKVSDVQIPDRIVLTEQHLTTEFGVELFPFISFPAVSTSLVILNLSFNDLDDTFWLHWVPDLRQTAWPALVTLNLANNRFSARGLDMVASFISRCPSLTELDLSLNLMSNKNLSPDWIMSTH